MIGICAKLNLLEFEDKIKIIPVGANRRRGAPGKNARALIHQSNDIQEEDECLYSGSGSDSELLITKVNKRKKKQQPEKNSDDSEVSDFDIFDDAKVRDAFQASKNQASKKQKIVGPPLIDQPMTSANANVAQIPAKVVKAVKAPKTKTSRKVPKAAEGFVPRVSKRNK